MFEPLPALLIKLRYGLTVGVFRRLGMFLCRDEPEADCGARGARLTCAHAASPAETKITDVMISVHN